MTKVKEIENAILENINDYKSFIVDLYNTGKYTSEEIHLAVNNLNGIDAETKYEVYRIILLEEIVYFKSLLTSELNHNITNILNQYKGQSNTETIQQEIINKIKFNLPIVLNECVQVLEENKFKICSLLNKKDTITTNRFLTFDILFDRNTLKMLPKNITTYLFHNEMDLVNSFIIPIDTKKHVYKESEKTEITIEIENNTINVSQKTLIDKDKTINDVMAELNGDGATEKGFNVSHMERLKEQYGDVEMKEYKNDELDQILKNKIKQQEDEADSGSK